jgi:hypothetical protein
MAEVKALPSAVGAFEAQVIDTSKPYNYLMQMANLRRRESLALRKEIEKGLNTALADKRAIRPQDSDYINGLRKDLNDFYSKNKADIDARGASYDKLIEKQGLLTSEITRSVSIKERGLQLENFAIKTMDPLKATDVSTVFKEALNVFRLPINDQRRKDYRFNNELNEDVEVDQMTVNDLNRIAYFRPQVLDDAISSIPSTPYQMQFIQKKKGGAPVGSDVTRKFASKSPFQIADKIKTTATVYPDMLGEFEKQSLAEQALYSSGGPTLQERVNKWFPKIVEFYQKAGAATKDGIGSIEFLFEERDGVTGVDVNNPYEYALFQKLNANLPRDLGMSYDYTTQSNWRAIQSFNLQKQNFYFQRSQANKPESLDGEILNRIKSGNFNGKEAAEWINTFVAQQESSLGNLVPAKVDFDDKNKTMSVTTTRALFNTDGSIITSRPVADALLAKNPKGGRVVPLATGGYAIVQTSTFDIDKTKPGWETSISSGLDMAEDAIINSSLKDGFDAIRSKRGKDVLRILQ